MNPTGKTFFRLISLPKQVGMDNYSVLMRALKERFRRQRQINKEEAPDYSFTDLNELSTEPHAEVLDSPRAMDIIGSNEDPGQGMLFEHLNDWGEDLYLYGDEVAVHCPYCGTGGANIWPPYDADGVFNKDKPWYCTRCQDYFHHMLQRKSSEVDIDPGQLEIPYLEDDFFWMGQYINWLKDYIYVYEDRIAQKLINKIQDEFWHHPAFERGLYGPQLIGKKFSPYEAETIINLVNQMANRHRSDGWTIYMDNRFGSEDLDPGQLNLYPEWLMNERRNIYPAHIGWQAGILATEGEKQKRSDWEDIAWALAERYEGNSSFARGWEAGCSKEWNEESESSLEEMAKWLSEVLTIHQNIAKVADIELDPGQLQFPQTSHKYIMKYVRYWEPGKYSDEDSPDYDPVDGTARAYEEGYTEEEMIPCDDPEQLFDGYRTLSPVRFAVNWLVEEGLSERDGGDCFYDPDGGRDNYRTGESEDTSACLHGFTDQEMDKIHRLLDVAWKQSKTADYGMTDFRDLDNDIAQSDPKYDLDPLYQGVEPTAQPYQELLKHLRTRRQNYFPDEDQHTDYLINKDVNTYTSSEEIPGQLTLDEAGYWELSRIGYNAYWLIDYLDSLESSERGYWDAVNDLGKNPDFQKGWNQAAEDATKGIVGAVTQEAYDKLIDASYYYDPRYEETPSFRNLWRKGSENIPGQLDLEPLPGSIWKTWAGNHIKVLEVDGDWVHYNMSYPNGEVFNNGMVLVEDYLNFRGEIMAGSLIRVASEDIPGQLSLDYPLDKLGYTEHWVLNYLYIYEQENSYQMPGTYKKHLWDIEEYFDRFTFKQDMSEFWSGVAKAQRELNNEGWDSNPLLNQEDRLGPLSPANVRAIKAAYDWVTDGFYYYRGMISDSPVEGISDDFWNAITSSEIDPGQLAIPVDYNPPNGSVWWVRNNSGKDKLIRITGGPPVYFYQYWDDERDNWGEAYPIAEAGEAPVNWANLINRGLVWPAPKDINWRTSSEDRCTNCGATNFLETARGRECLRCGAPVESVKPWDKWPEYDTRPTMYEEQYQAPYVSKTAGYELNDPPVNSLWYMFIPEGGGWWDKENMENGYWQILKVNEARMTDIGGYVSYQIKGFTNNMRVRAWNDYSMMYDQWKKGISDGLIIPAETNMEMNLPISKVASQVVQEEVPLDYKGKFAGTPMRFSIYIEPFETQDEYFKDYPGLVAWIDVFLYDNWVQIAYATVETQHRGQGFMRELVQYLYDHFPEEHIFWGKIFADEIMHLRHDFGQRYPDRTTKVSNEVADTDTPSRYIHIDRQDLDDHTDPQLALQRNEEKNDLKIFQSGGTWYIYDRQGNAIAEFTDPESAQNYLLRQSKTAHPLRPEPGEIWLYHPDSNTVIPLEIKYIDYDYGAIRIYYNYEVNGETYGSYLNSEDWHDYITRGIVTPLENSDGQLKMFSSEFVLPALHSLWNFGHKGYAQVTNFRTAYGPTNEYKDIELTYWGMNGSGTRPYKETMWFSPDQWQMYIRDGMLTPAENNEGQLQLRTADIENDVQDQVFRTDLLSSAQKGVGTDDIISDMRKNTCSKCGEVKENLKEAYCRSCKRAYTREWRKNNPENVKAFNKRANEKRKKIRKTKDWDRRSHLRSKFGIELEEYIEMLERQEGKCAICGCSTDDQKFAFAVDHDHKCCDGRKSCGECIRGLLCSRCNSAIGQLKEDVNILMSAIDYLNKYSDLEQDDTADANIYHTDLAVWTDPHLPLLKERENPKMQELQQYGDQIAFMYFEGELYFGSSIDDIISRHLIHKDDKFDSPSLSGTIDLTTGKIRYESGGNNLQPSMRDAFLHKLEVALLPNISDTPYYENDDILHADEEIYDKSLH